MAFCVIKETIKDVVDVLSQIKYLKELDINANYDEKYKLSVEDLALFQNLPVKRLDFEALDLKKDNVDDFHHIIRRMKIEFIGGFRKIFHGESLGISEQRFGPGESYDTI